MALSKPVSVVAGLAALSTPAAAFQSAGWASRAPSSNQIQQAGYVASASSAPVAGNSAVWTTAAVATCAVSAALLARARRPSTTVAMRGLKTSPGFNTLPMMDKKNNGFEGVIGDQPPLGYWDPLGFSKDGDIEKFKRRREVEIKHGRVAMFATIGYIVPEYFKFDGYLSPSQNLKFSDVPTGLAALSKVPTEGWGQILAFIGFIELVYNQGSPEPGNYGKGFLGLGSVGVAANISDTGARAKKLKAELANGRLAMMAIIGMFFQDGLTGSAWGDWANFTASPLRAFENELGVQAPVGFWDPVGFTADGNVASFRRRRTVELKHGRISMLAAMGYITPEVTGKFPGYLSPSAGLKFADVPNGLGALSVVPAAGWAQIAAYMGAVDVLGGFNDYKTGTPGDYGWKLLTSSDPAEKQVKLASELANGRLAMVAILAMFFQNGTVGTTGPEMWLPSNNGWNPAFENELGVQAPVGFWDPVGFTADGNVASFKRRRTVELKHGRISMLAAMGYITPEVTGKFPGYLSPSAGLKFADVPNGLGALSVVPAAGWAQIAAYMGAVDVLGGFNDYKTGTPGDYGWKLLTSSDPAEKQVKLASELANGRLAMVAILAMFFQNGTVGTTGPEMWLPSNNGWNP